MFKRNSKVKQLTSSNFAREVLEKEKPTMVAFTAPWCGHCQRLAPEFDKVADQLDGVVLIANVDCDEESNKRLCAQYGVQGFPTLKLFPATKKRLPRDYQGPRTASDIGAYVVDALPMGAKKLTFEQLAPYCEKDPDKPKVLLFSTKPKSSALYKSLALDFRQTLSFAFLRGDQASVRAAARSHLGVDIKEADLPVLLVVPSREEASPLEMDTYLRYDGQLKYHDIHAWIVGNVPEATKKPSKARAKTKNAKTKAKAKPAADKKQQQQQQQPFKVDIDGDLPPGAQYEWRAQDDNMSPEERQAKLEEIAAMLNEAAAKRGGQDKDESGSFSSSESGSYSHTYTEGSDGHVESDTEGSYSSCHASDGGERVEASYKVHSNKQGGAGAGPSMDSVREKLTQWFDGEQIDWRGEYGAVFDKAQRMASELLAKDPARAEQVAAEGEDWLLSYLVSDLELMKIAREEGADAPSLSDEQYAKVQAMYEQLKARKDARDKAEGGTVHDEL